MTNLVEISNYAKKLEEIEVAIERQEEVLSDLRSQRDQIRTELIPNAFSESGLSEITLENGDKVTISQKVNASFVSDAKIAKAKGEDIIDLKLKQDAQIEWLRESGNEDLIKNVVSVEFSKGEDANAEQLKNKLREEGHAVNKKADVHSRTLAAFMSQRLEAGEPIPYDLFNVSTFNIAKIQRAK